MWERNPYFLSLVLNVVDQRLSVGAAFKINSIKDTNSDA